MLIDSGLRAIEEKQGSGWKWVAGVFALIVTYQVGYDSGTKDAAATQPPLVRTDYASPLADVTGVDALTVSPSDTSAAPVLADLNALTASNEASNTTTDVDTALVQLRLQRLPPLLPQSPGAAIAPTLSSPRPTTMKTPPRQTSISRWTNSL